jgi:hypothetical protein
MQSIPAVADFRTKAGEDYWNVLARISWRRTLVLPWADADLKP